jgi:hypothetical protein
MAWGARDNGGWAMACQIDRFSTTLPVLADGDGSRRVSVALDDDSALLISIAIEGR